MGATPSATQKAARSDSSNRMSILGQRLPMPDRDELERRFNSILVSMDLPPDKARLLKSYDDERKWELVCEQEKVSVKESPESYLDKIRLYLDPQGQKNTKNLKNLSHTSSTKTLKELEISLRTNHIEWVRHFLSDENNGLDVLVPYLQQTQEHMRWEQQDNDEQEPVSNFKHGGEQVPLSKAGTMIRNQKRQSNRRMSTAKLIFGEATDDVHVCIMCLRAIMNHQSGFNLVFSHKQAINCIALCLNHKNFRTKTLVLELLAAVCLVSGGHEIIMIAFDNFKNACGETHRFETLMNYFQNYEEFHIDFMVACMQFINIIVHSVQSMNFRVHLQHEFSLLGLDEFLEKLKDTESDRLPVQVNAYLDNMIDVQILLEDSDMKNAALARVEELGETLSHANERIQELEDAYLEKTAELQEHLSEITESKNKLQEYCDQLEAEVKSYKEGKRVSAAGCPSYPSAEVSVSSTPSSPSIPCPAPMAPPPPPPPPAPPLTSSGAVGSFMAPPPPPNAPPPPGFGPVAVVSIKKQIQPKYRLPILNWAAMKPNDVKGTMFAEIDDEKLYRVINFSDFEECFKLGNLSLDDTDLDLSSRRTTKRPEKLTLLESNRVRNVAITRKKIDRADNEIVKAINGLDLKTLSLEYVEIILRILPNEQETKAYKEYERERKSVDLLADEDRFMMSLLRVERLSNKLHILSFIGNFVDTYHHLSPQLNAVYMASKSIRNSGKIRQLFEIILAFGNYMNSCKRGGVYGFKLQSLDMLVEMKSNDKKMSLLHFLVKTVKEKFPSVANFEIDFNYIEKAATASLENILTDISELEKGMELTKREYEARKDRDPPIILKDFLSNSEDKLKKLHNDAKNAREAFTSVVEYFGENPRMIAPSTFFSLFVRFGKAYRQAEIDLETQAKLEEAMLHKASTKKANPRQSQAAVVTELKGRQKQVCDKKVLNRDEVAHGTLEDLIKDIKVNPYRRADGIRRSGSKVAAIA